MLHLASGAILPLMVQASQPINQMHYGTGVIETHTSPRLQVNSLATGLMAGMNTSHLSSKKVHAMQSKFKICLVPIEQLHRYSVANKLFFRQENENE